MRIDRSLTLLEETRQEVRREMAARFLEEQIRHSGLALKSDADLYVDRALTIADALISRTS